MRRTPLHLGLQTAFNAVCVGQSPTPPLTHSDVQNQEEECRGEGVWQRGAAGGVWKRVFDLGERKGVWVLK